MRAQVNFLLMGFTDDEIEEQDFRELGYQRGPRPGVGQNKGFGRFTVGSPVLNLSMNHRPFVDVHVVSCLRTASRFDSEEDSMTFELDMYSFGNTPLRDGGSLGHIYPLLFRFAGKERRELSGPEGDDRFGA